MILSLIAEATECDFKREVEIDKPLSWLKSVSAFANGIGGSLFFGVGDDGKIIGLNDIQADGEAISRRIKDRMSPIPEFVLTPYSEDDNDVLVLVIKAGRSAPYYYSIDGNKRAYVRVGSESMRYMERRGSGLNKIVEETKKLPGYDDGFMPEFYSTISSFTVRLKNINYRVEQSMNRCDDGKADGIKDGNSDGIKDGIYADNDINETQKKILFLIAQNPSITIEQISEVIQINKRNTEKNISVLRNAGLVLREGGRKTGRWIARK
jgi:predicted HTH transcriptional regulator